MASESSSTPAEGTAWPYAPGDEIYVYASTSRAGLVTRVEGWALSVLEMVLGDGWEATLKRMVVVFRDAAGDLDICSPLCAAPVAAAAGAWHLVGPDGRVVGGGTRAQGRKPSMGREELEALRDAGTYKSLVGSVAVLGLPDGVLHAPSAVASDPVTAPTEGVFIAARGGFYRWFDPSS